MPPMRALAAVALAVLALPASAAAAERTVTAGELTAVVATDPWDLGFSGAGGATVLAADRDGPVVHVRIRRDDGVELDAVSLGDAPEPGARVGVEIDPAGVLEVPVWRADR